MINNLNINNNNDLDLINDDLLDDDFSNASGCGLPPVCIDKKLQKGTRRSCKKVLGREVCVNIPTVKTVVNQSCVDQKKRYKDCMNDPNRKKLLQKVKESATRTASNIKKGTQNIGRKVKTVVVRLKDRAGESGKNFRNKFRGVLRKGILFNISNNIHGTASRLYPAVATDIEVANKKYRKSFVLNSRNMYREVVSKWKSIGGKEDDLKKAIRAGQSKRFLKAPYKSFNGDDSMALYTFYTPSNLVSYINPNTTFYWGANGEYNPYEEVGVFDEYGEIKYEDSGEEQIEEIPSKEEEVRGIRAFFAWLKKLFIRNKTNENPYAEGTPEYEKYSRDLSDDRGNEPDEDEANDPETKDIYNKGIEDGAGEYKDEYSGDDLSIDDDKILGISKTYFWVGVGVLTLIGGFVAYKLIKGKQNK